MAKYNKPTSGLDLPPPVSDSPEPIKVDTEEVVSIAALASRGRDALVDQLRKHMVNSAPKEYTPPGLTDRQAARLKEEMDAGRRASERSAAQSALARQPKPDPTVGYTVPVYRPADHVPNFDSKDPGSRILK